MSSKSISLGFLRSSNSEPNKYTLSKESKNDKLFSLIILLISFSSPVSVISTEYSNEAKDAPLIISSGAFYNTSIKVITIPNSVSNIGGSVFGNSLDTLHCKGEVPPTIGTNSFGTNSNLKIYVPKGCVNKYKTNTYWSAYANNIQGEDPIVFEGGSGSSDWNVIGNWSGLPNGEISALADKDVIIRAAATIANEIEVKSYKIG
mgnify:CR=1 FL=1